MTAQSVVLELVIFPFEARYLDGRFAEHILGIGLWSLVWNGSYRYPDLPRSETARYVPVRCLTPSMIILESPTSGPTARHAVPNLLSFFCQPSTTLSRYKPQGLLVRAISPHEGLQPLPILPLQFLSMQSRREDMRATRMRC